MSADVFAAMDEARRDGRTVVMGTTVRTDGDPPSAPGNRALFAPDGVLLAGTIGCNGLDRKAGRDGAGLLAAGERAGIRAYTSFEGEPGEGVVEVFLEAFAGPPRLVVGGTGPVADALAAIGGIVGLAAEPAGQGRHQGRVVVVDDHHRGARAEAPDGLVEGGRAGRLGPDGQADDPADDRQGVGHRAGAPDDQPGRAGEGLQEHLDHALAG
ncbi:MAG TPA: XdhC family protein, partial [Actinomycetota bacterium]|nr:XdhC family protein [Actinomycetota bacterium]